MFVITTEITGETPRVFIFEDDDAARGAFERLTSTIGGKIFSVTLYSQVWGTSMMNELETAGA